MSFEKGVGFMCDHCETTEGYGEEFYEDKDTIDRFGWLTRNLNGDWYNFCCEECYQQFLEDRGSRIKPKKIKTSKAN